MMYWLWSILFASHLVGLLRHGVWAKERVHELLSKLVLLLFLYRSLGSEVSAEARSIDWLDCTPHCQMPPGGPIIDCSIARSTATTPATAAAAAGGATARKLQGWVLLIIASGNRYKTDWVSRTASKLNRQLHIRIAKAFYCHCHCFMVNLEARKYTISPQNVGRPRLGSIKSQCLYRGAVCAGHGSVGSVGRRSFSGSGDGWPDRGFMWLYFKWETLRAAGLFV